jgi:leucyl aminopeptidase
MRVTTTARSPAETRGDVVVQVVTGSQLPLARHLASDASDRILREDGAMTWLEPRRMRAQWVLCPYHRLDSGEVPVPCGSPIDDDGDPDHLRARQRLLGAQIERACDARAVEKVVLAPLPPGIDLAPVVEGILLRSYATLEFTPDEQATSVEHLVVCSGDATAASVRKQLASTLIEVEATNMTRHLADLPSNVGTPQEIVARVSSTAAEAGLRVKVFDDKRVRRLGLRLVDAVGGGSLHPPRVLVLEHNASRSRRLPTVVFVGKGVTHDTGGYNLKRSASIQEMSYDKSGAAAAIGAIHAIADLGLPVHAVAITPLVENAIGERAYKPGDILAGPGGTSIYVENTDAEGRLVLADCLAYASRYKPDLVVDIATLTDAAHMALGDPYAALYSNDDTARDVLLEAGKATGDLLWPMPIHSEHLAQMVHQRAHVRNSGGRNGAAGFAAAFLRRFVDYPWAHIDMGGRGHTTFERGVVGPGATGFGARLLVEATRRFIDRAGK